MWRLPLAVRAGSALIAWASLWSVGSLPAADDESASSGIHSAGTLFLWSGQTEPGGPPGMDEPLVSDRPDFTEASTTVGRGVTQLEMGYTLFGDNGGGVRTRSHSFPELLARMGIFADWFELRVAWNCSNTNQSSAVISQSIAGGEDLYLGAKFALTSQFGILPEMVLLPQMTVPTGHPAVTAGKVLPGVNWLYGWDVLEWLTCAGSTQANMAVDDTNDDYLEFAQSFTIGYALTERLNAYTEWFMITPAGAIASRTEHYLDGGFTLSVTNNLQLDIRGGIGISDASDDFFVGSGLVVRF